MNRSQVNPDHQKKATSVGAEEESGRGGTRRRVVCFVFEVVLKISGGRVSCGCEWGGVGGEKKLGTGGVWGVGAWWGLEDGVTSGRCRRGPSCSDDTTWLRTKRRKRETRSREARKGRRRAGKEEKNFSAHGDDLFPWVSDLEQKER